MPAGRYKVYIDWNNDGDFDDAREDVTSRVLDGRSPVTMKYGRDQDRALSPISAGEGHFALNNQSRDYSAENTSSPLNGLVRPARPVQITGTVNGGPTYTMLRGVLDDFRVQPGRDQRYVDVDVIDPLGQLNGVTVTTGLYQGLRPGEAAAILLDAVGWPAALRDLDVGATVMPYWWLDGDDAFTALLDLVYSEGPPSLVTVDSSGRIVFRGRHHRLQNAPSITAQSTWRSSGGVEPLFSAPADYNHGWKEIVNSVGFELPQRGGSGVLSQVWSSPGQISIASGDTLPIVVQGTNPFINAVTPVQTTAFDDNGNPNGDFTLLSGVVTVTLGRTSGLSTTISIQAVGGPAVIADLQLRAYPITTVNTVQVQAEDGPSIATYGRRSLPDSRSPKWASLGDAQAIAQIILSQRSERLPTISVTMVSANTTRLTQQLIRDLSDRVRIVESHTGLDADCYVEQIGHSITEGGANHTTTFGLEKIPAQIPDVFILGSATNGVLGTNRLGKRGFTDPSVMFVLGSGTNGVLGANILTP